MNPLACASFCVLTVLSTRVDSCYSSYYYYSIACLCMLKIPRAPNGCSLPWCSCHGTRALGGAYGLLWRETTICLAQADLLVSAMCFKNGRSFAGECRLSISLAPESIPGLITSSQCSCAESHLRELALQARPFFSFREVCTCHMFVAEARLSGLISPHGWEGEPWFRNSWSHCAASLVSYLVRVS